MSRVDELLATIRQLVTESRDEQVPGFYHDAGNGAYLAAAFDELDELLSGGADDPADWKPQA